MPFQHLHLHNEYSVLDGFGTADQYAQRAKEMDFTHLALTNHGNIDGCIKWQRACSKAGIKGIVGTEAYIVPDITRKFKGEKRGHITFLVANMDGWTELCRVLTIANLDGFYHRPRIDFDILRDMDLSSIVVMTGCAVSFLSLPGAIDVLDDLYKKDAKLYFEIMPHDIVVQKEHHKLITDLTKDFSIPLVAANDCHYILRSEWRAQEALLAIQTGKTWDDPKRWTFGFKGLHLRSEKEMFKAFQRQGDFTDNEIMGALDITSDIAGMCEGFEIPKQGINLPKVADDPDKELDRLCNIGLQAKGLSDTQAYKARYIEEYALIKKKRFVDYFLIVHDLIQYAIKEGIMRSPGRGSVGGCLIAYLLDVHVIDPIQHNLSFSRFISEDRIDWPDIDLDFEKQRRPDIVAYIETKYGKYNTCGISTDSRLKGRAVLNDMGKVFKVPRDQIAEVTREIDSKLKKDAVQDCFDNTKAGARFFVAHKDAAKLAMKLEGQLRQHGLHPGAVVISADELTDGSRGNLKMQKGRIVSCWDMDDAEYSGLMKLDILGLSTLSVLAYCKELINWPSLENPDKDIEKPFGFDKIPFDDPKVFKEISDGNTAGIFQISGRATTELAKDMTIETFNDIVALIALVRPGPMDSGMTELYIERTVHHCSWVGQHDIYEEVTKDTAGILIYQEQVMQVISKVAGLSESTADKIRKVIGKKRDPEEFKKYESQFIAGCKKMKTFNPKEAEEFWEGLQKWASYGFNKAHSTGYATLAYWTMWCKVNYPAEFLAATLTYDEKEDKQRLIADAYRYNLKVQYPKMNISDPLRWVIKENTLYAPFIEIAGVGDTEALKIAGKGKKKKTKTKAFFDVKPTVNKASTSGQLLKQAGAFDPDLVIDPDAAKELFSFTIDNNVSQEKYPRLKELLVSLDPIYLAEQWIDVPDEFVNGLSLPSGLIEPTHIDMANAELKNCYACPLGNQTEYGPVFPSIGTHNIMLVGEAPGPQEDKEGTGFYEDAPAGKLLWESLGKHKLPRSLFYVSNICKCYPSEKGTPTTDEIDTCYKAWLSKEIERVRPYIILAFGNSAVYAFTGKKGGIQSLSGTTQWNEKAGAWIVWCIHPAAIKRRDSNMEYWDKGIEGFYKTLLKAWER